MIVFNIKSQWAINSYCGLVVGSLARYLYEFPRGLDERLASPPVDWPADVAARYEHYLGLAESLYV